VRTCGLEARRGSCRAARPGTVADLLLARICSARGRAAAPPTSCRPAAERSRASRGWALTAAEVQYFGWASPRTCGAHAGKRYPTPRSGRTHVLDPAGRRTRDQRCRRRRRSCPAGRQPAGEGLAAAAVRRRPGCWPRRASELLFHRAGRLRSMSARLLRGDVGKRRHGRSRLRRGGRGRADRCRVWRVGCMAAKGRAGASGRQQTAGSPRTVE